MSLTSDVNQSPGAADASLCRRVAKHLALNAVIGVVLVGAAEAAIRYVEPLPLATAVAVIGLLCVVATSLLLGVQLCRLFRERDTVLTSEQAVIAERARTLELLEAVATSSTDLITAKDLEGRYLFVNRAAEQLLGRSRQEILGRNAAAVMPRRHATAIAAHDREARYAVGSLTFEEEIAGHDGTITYLSIRGPLHDAAGRVVGNYGISRDITPRQRLGQEIRERERDFRMLAEQVPAIIYRAALDADSSTLYISPAIAALGYTPQEWVADAQAWSRAIHPDDADRVNAALEVMRHDRSNSDLVIEYRLRDKAGHWRHYCDVARIVFDESGQALFLQGVMVDISDRVAAEAALAASERRYAVTLDVVNDAIWDWDVGAATGFASPAYYRMLGEEACATIALDAFFERIHPDDLPGVGETTARMADCETGVDLEFRLRHADGHWIWVHSRGHVLERNGAGRVARLAGTLTDVTERRRREEALRVSELRFRLAAAHGHVWDWDVAQRRLEFSPQFWAALGYHRPVAERAQDRLEALLHAEDRDQLHDAIGGHLEHRLPFACEFRLRTRRGDWRWFLASGQAMWDDHGRPTYMAGTTFDITERKCAQEALREREERLRHLFQQVTDGIFVVGEDGQFHEANPEGLAMLGCSREELKNLRLHDVLVDFACHRQDTVSGALPGERAPLVEWDLTRRDGSLFAAEVGSRSLGGDRTLLVVRDVSQRNADIARLRWLSQAVEQCSESIVITDVQARIVYANAAALASSGYTLEELAGRNPRLLKSGETPPETHSQMWRNLARGEPWKGHLFNQRKDGRRYVEFAVLSPIRNSDGRTTHFVGVKEDVTDKLGMERELEQHRDHLEQLVESRTAALELATKAAEAANRAKSAFLATMSHEIRTPMNGVIGTLDVLSRSSLTPNQIELTAMIRESALVLLHVIDDILDFSKIEAGKLDLEHGPVCLAQLVESVAESLEAIAAAKGVRVRVFADPGLPAWVASDATRLRQILNNLLGNAIKFSAGLERTGEVELVAEPDGDDRVRLTVRDNGIGMAPAVQERVFEPFTQAENSTTRRYGGSGLGLSICRRLVDLLGGSIQLVSALHQGTTFEVTLPVARTTSEAPAETDRHDLRGLTVWVAASPPKSVQWSAYIARAGGTVRPWPGTHAASRTLAEASDEPRVVVAEGPADASHALVACCAEHGVGLVLVDDASPRRPALLAPALASLGAGAMRRAALEEAIALVAGRLRPAAPHEEPADAAAPSAELAVQQGRLVLVAEDNDINQQLIRRQLALLKIQCEIAGDGAQALALWRTGRFSMLLTDLHMPVLDGYELAARIRSQERPGERLPIVALTANATKGEADRCRAVGMDDYLTKPVDLDRLRDVLTHGLERPASMPALAPAAANEAPVLDASVLPKLIGPDPAVLARFNEDYIASAHETVEAIRRAADSASWPVVAALAHRLKSSSRAVGALALGEACSQLEGAGKTDDAMALLALVGQLQSALAKVLPHLGRPLSPASHEPPARVGTEPRVVLVDDEPFQLQLLTQQLRDLGLVHCDTCTSGLSMLESLRGQDTSAHLVLLDLDMPDMDGVEVIRHLSEQKYAGALAVISGADERLLEAASRLAAAYRIDLLPHLHKPVPLDALRRLIDQWRLQRCRPAVSERALKVYSPAEIRHAIAAGQMLLHYQPKVCLKTGSVEGVEALVRWHHPIDGLISPDRFVSMAEGYGLIDELTHDVIRQALQQASRWRRAGLRLRVAVNVSMDNLARLDFPELVLDALAGAGVPATDLLLEVTESRLMQDARAPLDILTRLRLKQIGLSIDDFGTGHSSLAQLRDIPFDELKIDRSFVHAGDRRPTERAIFQASLGMAHQLAMRVVAEGVEDQADWDFVRAAGCDVAQGFFVARPMLGDAIAGWVAAWSARREELLS